MKRTFAFGFLLSLIALTTVVPVQQVFADAAQDRLQVSDVFELVSLRGIAYERAADRRIEVKMSLRLTVVDVNGSRVRFKITGGEITVGDKVFALTDGQGSALLRKFGWTIIQGDAKLASGQMFKLRLHGVLHIRRTGLAVSRLVGGLGSGTEQIRLRLLLRLSRSQR